MARPRTPLATRFKEKYKIQEDGCWIWTGAVGKNGYGNMLLTSSGSDSRENVGAHVASYMIHHGSIPDGFEVDHVCMRGNEIIDRLAADPFIADDVAATADEPTSTGWCAPSP